MHTCYKEENTTIKYFNKPLLMLLLHKIIKNEKIL